MGRVPSLTVKNKIIRHRQRAEYSATNAWNLNLNNGNMNNNTKDKQVLSDAVPKIREKLAELKLRINEKKFYLQHYTKGVEFTGSIVKPHRKYCCNRTITNFVTAIRRLNAAKNLRQIEHAVCSINSYLGLLRHSNEYAMRRKILAKIDPKAFEYIYIKGHHEVVCIKKKFQKQTILQQRIRDGDY